jgi:hypothetical protein
MNKIQKATLIGHEISHFFIFTVKYSLIEAINILNGMLSHCRLSWSRKEIAALSKHSETKSKFSNKKCVQLED